MLLSTSRAAISSLLHPSFPKLKLSPFLHLKTRHLFTETPTPLLYDCIRYRPVRPSNPPRHRSKQPSSSSDDADSSPPSPMDRSKRKYYRKRAKRMYGSSSDAESDADSSRRDSDLVELKPEIVEFRTQHLHEQELYFHDVFAFPWEKQKHYRMMYELEKKYFPDQCLDKAFLDPNAEPPAPPVKKGKKRTTKGKEKEEEEAERDERALVFFEDAPVVAKDGAKKGDVKEKKVEEFFKCLKKSPSGGRGGERSVVAGGNEVVGAEPFLVSRRTEMPPRWDGPAGTVVLVDKPKGWTSFTVCGKLRRLVKVQKVGHAGTLDPMATGLLIVCIGKATKVVDRYQGMVKSYSGVFRLGEATSTWDADSPVIQREPWEHIKDDDMKKTAASFLGEIWQVPPMFSAIKVGGEKMYDKARRGEMIELSPRRISIFQFDIERSLDDRQNLIFRVTCSKGTYIRSLCADFGKALGSCAHLTALRRDSIGEYTADDAWSFQELEEAITKGYF